ncbi:hypothetical protein EVAR_8944_1 [Eumeta japonica]|uniref:Uncharacterized protein n=1 Tax=Eumeta variegata TaxID=151549 RepID=A0A4C1U0B8_EUMVA|nr:hypothetical protein EVAR_8944_1 [Eumeta japonica]
MQLTVVSDYSCGLRGVLGLPANEEKEIKPDVPTDCSDARRRGSRVYAYIRSRGSASGPGACELAISAYVTFYKQTLKSVGIRREYSRRPAHRISANGSPARPRLATAAGPGEKMQAEKQWHSRRPARAAGTYACDSSSLRPRVHSVPCSRSVYNS